MGKGSVFRALAVLAFGGCLGLAGYQNPALGTDTAEAAVVNVQNTAGEAVAETEEADAGEAVAELPNTETEQKKENIVTDLTDTFDIILKGADREFLAGYPVDETFLMWMGAQYGEDAVIAVAGRVSDGTMDTAIWHEMTGKSMHVLWMQFCEEMGYQRELLGEVCQKDASDSSQTILGFSGSLNLADASCTMAYMAQQPEGILSCISAEVLAEMQHADMMQVSQEFVYSKEQNETGAAFCAASENIDLLEHFGTDLVALIGSHGNVATDGQIQETEGHLTQKQIPYLKSGQTVSFVINGRKITYAAMAGNGQAADAAAAETATAGTAAEPVRTPEEEQFLSSIREAKETSDYVIALAYWGTEGALYADVSQKNLAQECAKAGADAVIGCHSHRLQGAAFVEGIPVVYGLGNLWFSDGTLYTSLAQLVISGDGTLSLRYLPCVQEGMQTRLLTADQEKQEFYHYLASISSKVGIDAAGNVYNKAAENYPAETIVYDSETSTTEIRGVGDNEGRAIDSVGNLK